MHSVVFKNTENDWEKALALGNGVLGTMVYFQNSSRFLPINHYESYYCQAICSLLLKKLRERAV